MAMENSYKRIKIFSQKLLYLLSLSKPFSRVIVFSSGLILLFLLPTDKLYYLPIRSIYETIFHFKPYSSGITRAVSTLLHGDLKGAWNFNPLVYLIILISIVILIKDLVYLIKTRDFSI